jgi:hypothetical protein
VELTLTAVLVIFGIGFLLHRSGSVRLAAGLGLLLGVLLANGWLGHLGHTLDGAFRSLV